MQIVVVSSPGMGTEPHWSQEAAGELARLAVARGATVRWLAALHRGHPVPPGESGVQVIAYAEREVLSSGAVVASQEDSEVELAVTECLRAEPLSVVVHFGLGGQGTPNVLWLADRLGSPTFACVRGSELVCHRGDLLDRDKRICTDWSDAQRCSWCCSESRPRPSSDDMQNRVDLFTAGLATCSGVFVSAAEDVAYVESVGASKKSIEVGATPDQMFDRIAAAASKAARR